MPNVKPFEITLQLAEIEHLFVKPNISPLSEHYQVYYYTAGIEFISDELYADPSHDSVKLRILLPAAQITHDLQAQTQAAVARYCQGRLTDVNHDIHATLWRGRRALALALLALFVLVGASRVIDSDINVFRQVISEGLSIAAWVSLWVPLDMLIFKVWEHRLDKKIYTLLSKMQIAIEPLEQFSA